MSNQYFDFKQFRICQDKCAMKVGTDGVLLGAWFQLSPGDRVLDIGTGTGLVALMAAQRGAGHVTAIEIDGSAAGQAAYNVQVSPFHDRIIVKETDANSFTAEEPFDRIVCNPPFFRNSLRCPDESRNMARHNDNLSYEQLVVIAVRLLKENGEFTVVLPAEKSEEFKRICATGGLFLKRICQIVTVIGKAPKRSLMTFGRYASVPEITTMPMCDTTGAKTPEFTALIKDFYIR